MSAVRTTCQIVRLPHQSFELESVLIEHPAIAEAAVVPSPRSDAACGAQGFSRAGARHVPDRATALSISSIAEPRSRRSKRVRRLEFSELPKTIPARSAASSLRRAEAAISGRQTWNA